MKSSYLNFIVSCLGHLPAAVALSAYGSDIDAWEPKWQRHGVKYGRRCVVPANNDGTDDSPAIIEAFTKCHKNAVVVFQNTTYNIEQAMAFKDLHNVKVDIKGTLLVSLRRSPEAFNSRSWIYD